MTNFVAVKVNRTKGAWPVEPGCPYFTFWEVEFVYFSDLRWLTCFRATVMLIIFIHNLPLNQLSLFVLSIWATAGTNWGFSWVILQFHTFYLLLWLFHTVPLQNLILKCRCYFSLVVLNIPWMWEICEDINHVWLHHISSHCAVPFLRTALH